MLGRLRRRMPPAPRFNGPLCALVATCTIGAMAAQAATATASPVESVSGTTLPANGYSYDNGEFFSSSCGSSGACVSVGDYKDDSANFQGLILATDAGVPAANGAVESSLAGDNVSSSLAAVSCWSSTACVSVGYYDDTGADQQALVVPITSGVPGPAQEITPPVSPSPNPVNAHPVASLRGVSCEPSGVCVAVGVYHDTSGGYEGFEVTIDHGIAGASAEVPAPANSAATQSVFLTDVSCQSSGSCIAVGSYQYDSSGDTYAMVAPITNGVPGTASAVNTVPSNADPLQEGWLSNVACPATGSCSAIGGYMDSTANYRTMVVPITAGVAGGGTEVSLPADSTDTEISDVAGISCQSAGQCVAVGNYTIAASTQAVAIPIDNGVPTAAVRVVLPPDAAPGPDARLKGVGCPTAGACMAAGIYKDTGGVYHAITVAFDAGTLSGAAVPQTPGDLSATDPFSGLTSVGCATASCALVGDYTRASDNQATPFVLSAQAPLVIGPASLPSGSVSSAYSQALSITGAWGMYGGWSLSSGSLPAGLSLNPQTGVISGTPTAGGTSVFTVQDAATTGMPLQVATQSYSVSIAAAPVAPTPSLTLLTHSAVVRNGRFGLRLGCSSAPCAGIATLQINGVVTVRHGKKKVRRHVKFGIGTIYFSLAAGKASTFTVTLNGPGRRALTADHRLTATVFYTLKGVKHTAGVVLLKAAVVKHKKKR